MRGFRGVRVTEGPWMGNVPLNFGFECMTIAKRPCYETLCFTDLCPIIKQPYWYIHVHVPLHSKTTLEKEK